MVVRRMRFEIPEPFVHSLPAAATRLLFPPRLAPGHPLRRRIAARGAIRPQEEGEGDSVPAAVATSFTSEPSGSHHLRSDAAVDRTGIPSREHRSSRIPPASPHCPQSRVQ